MFSYLNLHTVYKCNGAFSKSTYPDGDYCFRKIFSLREDLDSKSPIKETYEIYMFKGEKSILKTRRNNACFFTPKQIKNHLEVAKRNFCDFKYKIEEKNFESKFPGYCVTLSVDKEFLYHRVLLTWVRNLYEYPTNMITMDAYRLQRHPRFRFINIPSIYNIVSGCYNTMIHDDYKYDQTIGNKGGIILTSNQIKNRLSNLIEIGNGNELVIGQIFPKAPSPTNYEFIQGDCQNLGYWEDHNHFMTKRLPIYIKRLDFLSKK